MASMDAIRFLELISEEEELRREVRSCRDMASLVSIANRHGYEFSGTAHLWAVFDVVQTAEGLDSSLSLQHLVTDDELDAVKSGRDSAIFMLTSSDGCCTCDTAGDSCNCISW